MTTNGRYEGQFERLVEMTERIDRTTEENRDQIGSLAVHLRKISDNTTVVAHHYAEARADNRELSRLAAGKQQVPLSLVVIALVFGGVWILVDKIEQGDIEIRIPFLGIDITHRRAEVMGADFDKAFALVLIYEGGYVDDPDDAGGETRFGISKAAHPDVDVKNLTLEGAKGIYRKLYWERYRCGELPWPLAFTLFDCVVQFSPANPIRWLQSAVGASVDGVLGPRTIEAARRLQGARDGGLQMMILRGEYRISHPKYRKFGKGWRARDLMVMCEAARRGAA